MREGHMHMQYKLLFGNTIFQFCFSIGESRFWLQWESRTPCILQNIFSLFESICMEFKVSALCSEKEKSHNMYSLAFKKQFAKEILKIAKFHFEICIAQLTNTVIVCCLHISCIDVQSLFCTASTEFWLA